MSGEQRETQTGEISPAKLFTARSHKALIYVRILPFRFANPSWLSSSPLLIHAQAAVEAAPPFFRNGKLLFGRSLATALGNRRPRW